VEAGRLRSSDMGAQYSYEERQKECEDHSA